MIHMMLTSGHLFWILIYFQKINQLILKLFKNCYTVDPVYSERVGAAKSVH